jgi:hypothetical protein
MTMQTMATSRGARAVALVLLGIGVIVAVPRAARADAYKDEKLGFSVSSPSKWKQMPISTDDQWRVAEWQSPREFEDADTKTNSWTRQTPKLDVIIIPNSAADQKGAEVQKDGDKVHIKMAAPWKDLKEYMDKKAQSDGPGGYYFSKDAEESKVGDVKVLFYEITFDKFTSTYNNAPRKWYGWAFYGTDAIYGLVGEALVKFEDKVKPDLEAAVRSFKIFPRTGTLPGQAVTPNGDGSDIVIKGDPSKEHLTDADLKKRRTDAFNQHLSKIKGSLAAGWKIKDSENFTAVTHCDDKFTKEVLDHAEALRAWLDTNLGFVGNGYAGKVVLRVCADENERAAMHDSMGYSWDRCEVVTGQDKNGWMDNKLSELNGGIYTIWMRDKNMQLAWSLPPWISSGLYACVSSAVSKGRKITDFKATTWDNVEMANMRRANKLLEARTFFTMDQDTMWKDWETHRQAEAFVRYLLIGNAHTNPKYKNVLADYIKNLVILLDEQHDAKGAAGASDEPKTEEEEAARQRALSEAWKKEEQDTLKKLVEKTFPGWDDNAWKSFNAAYMKELGG